MSFKVEVTKASNSEVRGRVKTVTTTPIPYQDITVTLRGASVVYLPRHERSISYGKYCAKIGRPGFSKVYVDETRSVNQTGGGSMGVLSGEQHFEFYFTFIQGVDLPSSINGPLGDVRYFVEARLLRNASNPVAATSRAAFDFIGTVDVGKPELAAEARLNLRKEFCCTSGQVSATVVLEKRGFLPGEDIRVNVVNFDNQSSKQVQLRVKLLRKLMYIAGGHKAYYPSKTIAVTESRPTATSEGTLMLAVPANTEPTLDETYIKRVYVVKLSLVVPRGINSTSDIPVVIGTCRSQY